MPFFMDNDENVRFLHKRVGNSKPTSKTLHCERGLFMLINQKEQHVAWKNASVDFAATRRPHAVHHNRVDSEEVCFGALNRRRQPENDEEASHHQDFVTLLQGVTLCFLNNTTDNEPLKRGSFHQFWQSRKPPFLSVISQIKLGAEVRSSRVFCECPLTSGECLHRTGLTETSNSLRRVLEAP